MKESWFSGSNSKLKGDLVSSSGDSMHKKEESFRSSLATEARKEKKEKDLLIKESNSFSNKVRKFFNSENSKTAVLNKRAKNISSSINFSLTQGKRQIQENMRKEIYEVLKDTVIKPCIDLSDSFWNGLHNISAGDRLWDKEKEEIIDKLNINNLKIAFLDPDLWEKIEYSVMRLFRSPVAYGNNARDLRKILRPLLDELKGQIESGKNIPKGTGILEILDASVHVAMLEKDIKKDEKGNDSFWSFSFGEKRIVDFIRNEIQRKYEKVSYQKKIEEKKVLDELLFNKEAVNIINLVRGRIQEAFEKEDFISVFWFCKSESVFEREMALNILDGYLSDNFQISLNDIYGAWDLNPGNALAGDGEVNMNILKMRGLEESHPGGVKFLLENYGIKEFRRYPVEILEAQIDEERSSAPYGLVLFPRNDYKGAFDNDENILRNIFSSIKDSYRMKITESDSTFDFARKILSLDKKFGKENKVSFIIVGAHGSPDSFTLGDPYNLRDHRYAVLEQKQIENHSMHSLGRYFIKNPQVVFFSCSTGKEGGLAEAVANEFDAEAIAPSKDATVVDVKAEVQESGKIKFSVEYGLGAETMIYHKEKTG